MKLHRGFIIGLLSLLLLSCTSTTKNLNAEQALESNQGIVVTKLHSNWEGYDNPLLADLIFVFSEVNGRGQDHQFKLSKAGDLKVVALPAGEYQWFRLLFGNYYLDLSGGFTVKPGEITYIGDIHTDLDMGTFSVGMETLVTDESAQIQTELNEHYPNMLSQHTFTNQVTSLL